MQAVNTLIQEAVCLGHPLMQQTLMLCSCKISMQGMIVHGLCLPGFGASNEWCNEPVSVACCGPRHSVAS